MIVNVTQTDSNLSISLGVPGSGSSLALPNSWLRAQRSVPFALTDAANLVIDMSLSNNFLLTLSGNHVLANPIGMLAGQAGQIVVVQSAPGNFTLSFGTNWKFRFATPPVLSTDAGAIDILSYYVIDPARIAVSAGLGFA